MITIELNGISVYDDCTRLLYDEDRDEEYPAWTAMNSDAMDDRRLDRNALPFIYSIKGNVKLNHRISTGLRNSFQKGRIKLLQNELHGKDFLDGNKAMDYRNRSEEEKAKMLNPYIQTTALTNELVNLEYESTGGYIKIKEVGANRKDRYSSLAYGNHYADILEDDLKRRSTIDATEDDDSIIMF